MCYKIEYEPADIVIYVEGKGIVLREKSVIAFQKDDGKILAFGMEAERMAAENRDDNIEVMSPLRRGMVEDFAVAERLFSLLFVKALGKRPVFRRPILRKSVVVCAPKGITPVEKTVIKDVMISAGAKEVLISDIPAEKFIREFPEKFPAEYGKFKIIVGITKEEPEQYVEEALKNILAYARQEQISQERVWELLRKLGEE